MKEQQRKNEKESKKILIIVILVLVILLLLGMMLVSRLFQSKKTDMAGAVTEVVEDVVVGEEGKVYTLTKAELQQVVTTSKLYTAEYPYNGIATVYETDGTGVKYYVAYEGKVKAGIDVSKIQVELDEAAEVITIRLPQVEMEEPIVDAGTLQYIFEDEKYNTEHVAQEAYKIAIADLKKKLEDDETILSAATQTAKTAEKAMVEPWVNQVDETHQYTVRVLAFGEEE